jgi:hypothetical protein
MLQELRVHENVSHEKAVTQTKVAGFLLVVNIQPINWKETVVEYKTKGKF